MTVKRHVRIIMRDFAAQMMKNVRFRYTVGRMCTDPAHNAAKVSKKTTVQSGECPADKSECVSAVVGNLRTDDEFISLLLMHA